MTEERLSSAIEELLRPAPRLSPQRRWIEAPPVAQEGGVLERAVGQPAKLGRVRRHQPAEQRLATPREGHAHPPGVHAVPPSGEEAGLDGSVEEADGALVLDLKTLGKIGDRRRPVKRPHE